MKKWLIVLFLVCFCSFFSFGQSYQYYKWKGFNPGIFCNDTTMQDCAVLNFEVDTLRNVLWIFGQFQGAGNINCPYIVGYQDGQFITFPDTFSGWGDSNDYLFYQGNLVGCLAGGVWSYDMNAHQFTTIGLFPTSIYNGGMRLAEYHGNLYVGGQFYAIKGPTGGWVAAQGVAKWNGTNWSPLGSGIEGAGPPYVEDMVVYQNKLIIGGGNFLLAGVNDGWNIVQWNDTTLSNVCSGGTSPGTTNVGADHWSASVLDMEVFQNKLYMVGYFDSVCSIKSYLAYWDGMNWTNANYPYMVDHFMKSFNNNLIIFTGFGSGPHLDWWTNNQMYPAPQLQPTFINAMETFHDTLYAGGTFVSSNGEPTFRLARLVYDSTNVGTDQSIVNSKQLTIYPNPADETVNVKAENIKEIVVTNLLGEIVQSLKYKVQSAIATIDISALLPGVYFIKVQTNDGWRVGKVVKQ